MLDCKIVECKFEQKSHPYIHFQTNTLDKDMNPLIPLAMGWIVPLLFFSKDSFGIR